MEIRNKRDIFTFKGEEWQVVDFYRNWVQCINLTDVESGNYNDNWTISIYPIDFADIEEEEMENREEERVNNFISSQTN